MLININLCVRAQFTPTHIYNKFITDYDALNTNLFLNIFTALCLHIQRMLDCCGISKMVTPIHCSAFALIHHDVKGKQQKSYESLALNREHLTKL